ncbi:hypothetical protein BCT61_17315 [Vibrio breoganii]|uniref:glycosyltransferase n=1 Tax=Vibrio breoganii TaxID=553239 RepID=UPI000C857E96|nr:glycosyltransferase [Vibrio breoganii]PMM04012.1 hypothetical protein BCT61_17315 [Vibrio breoganii]
MKVSIVVKALNEEKKIERCLSSLVKERDQLLAQGISVEIILVDSCSIDKTIEIASTFDIDIVQFKNKLDANCGSAVQLGYQRSNGDYIYLIDGDMEAKPGFINKALDYLKRNYDCAGVSGIIHDELVTSQSDRQRVNSYSRFKNVTSVKSLGGGGLYRKEAILSVGYMGHKSLESCEELELAVRLKKQNWNLVRLPIKSVSHVGHGLSDVQLVIKYFKANRFLSIGKVIKSSIGKEWYYDLIMEFKYIVLTLAINLIAIVVSLIYGISLGISSWLFFNLVTFFALAIRKQCINSAFISMFTWYLSTIHALLGITKKLKRPNTNIDYLTIKRSND